MNLLQADSPYRILVLSLGFYFCIYYRRNRGIRGIMIPSLLEKILFPFSNEGEAALGSIIIAAYMEVSLPVSYLLIIFVKFPEFSVQYIWNRVTTGVIFLGIGIDVFYELPASRERKLLKAVAYLLAAGMIAYGCCVLLTGNYII